MEYNPDRVDVYPLPIPPEITHSFQTSLSRYGCLFRCGSHDLWRQKKQQSGIGGYFLVGAVFVFLRIFSLPHLLSPICSHARWITCIRRSINFLHPSRSLKSYPLFQGKSRTFLTDAAWMLALKSNLYLLSNLIKSIFNWQRQRLLQYACTLKSISYQKGCLLQCQISLLSLNSASFGHMPCSRITFLAPVF